MIEGLQYSRVLLESAWRQPESLARVVAESYETEGSPCALLEKAPRKASLHQAAPCMHAGQRDQFSVEHDAGVGSPASVNGGRRRLEQGRIDDVEIVEAEISRAGIDGTHGEQIPKLLAPGKREIPLFMLDSFDRGESSPTCGAAGTETIVVAGFAGWIEASPHSEVAA